MSTALAHVVDFDPTRDTRHREARSARELADWLAWLELGGTAPRTLADYEWAASRVLRFYPGKAFAEITDADLLHVLRDFPAPSRRVRTAALRSWFKWGVRTRKLDRNPFDLLPDIRQPPRRRIEVFTDDEIDALTSLSEGNGDLFLILFETGLRRAEARHARVRDIRFDETAEIRIPKGKGGKPREVQFGPRLENRLRIWFRRDELRPNDHLWPTRPGGYYLRRTTPMGDCSFQKWWADCIAAAGVDYRNPHTTRHTFATRWLRRGGRLETLSILLGHASIKTTYDLYAHLDITDVLRDLQVIEGGK